MGAAGNARYPAKLIDPKARTLIAHLTGEQRDRDFPPFSILKQLEVEKLCGKSHEGLSAPRGSGVLPDGVGDRPRPLSVSHHHAAPSVGCQRKSTGSLPISSVRHFCSPSFLRKAESVIRWCEPSGKFLLTIIEFFRC